MSELGPWAPGRPYPKNGHLEVGRLYHLTTALGRFTVLKDKNGAYRWRGLYPTEGYGVGLESFRAATGHK